MFKKIKFTQILTTFWNVNVTTSEIVGNHSTFFRYTSYVPWAIWLANLVFINIREAGETNPFPMKSHVTIKYNVLFYNNDVILWFSYLK